MSKIRILIVDNYNSPSWINASVFINDEYMKGVQNITYTIGVETELGLEIIYHKYDANNCIISEYGRPKKHKIRYGEFGNDIKISRVTNHWKDKLQALR